MNTISQHTKNVCIVNYTGALFHVGCQSVSYVLENELKKRFGKSLNIEYIFSTTHNMGGEIPFAEDGFDIVLDSLRNNNFFLDRLRKTDLLIINGEGTLHWPTNNNRVWYWLACIHIAKEKFGIPVWVINSSFFSRDRLFRKFSAEMLKKADYIALRDPVSHEAVKDLGIKNAVNAADLTFLLPNRINKDVASYFEKKHPYWKKDNKKTRIVLAGSSAILKVSISLWAENYLKIIRGLKERFSNIQVLFIAQPDMGIDYALFSKLKTECDYIDCLERNITPAEFIWILQQSDLAISGRFHVNTIAIISNTPAVFLSGNTPKNKVIAQMISSKNYSFFDLYEIEKVIEKSEELCGKTDTDLNQTSAFCDSLPYLAEKNFPIRNPCNDYKYCSIDLIELINQVEFVQSSLQKRELLEIEKIVLQKEKLIRKNDELKNTLFNYEDQYKEHRYFLKIMFYLTHPFEGFVRLKHRVIRKMYSFKEIPSTPSVKKRSFHNAEIKVLHVSVTPLAGSTIRMCRLLDSSDFFSAISVCRRHTYNDGRSFDYDIVYEPLNATNYDNELILDLVEQCDIVHFHNEAYHQRYGIFKKLHPNKPVCIQWHSGPDEISSKIDLTIQELSEWQSIPTFVVAQKQSLFYPNSIPVPNIVDIRLPEYKPVKKDNEIVHICYSPTSVSMLNARLCGDKGRKTIMKALKNIKKIYSDKVQIHIIEGLPLNKCLDIRQKCHISIDDIKTGGYHIASLEALAQGSVAIANLSKKMKEFISQYTGSNIDELPWFVASEENTLERLKELIENVELISEIGKKSREWMEKYWNYDFIIRKMKLAYIKVLDKNMEN